MSGAEWLESLPPEDRAKADRAARDLAAMSGESVECVLQRIREVMPVEPMQGLWCGDASST